MGHGLAQPRRIQPPRHVQQHRFGLGRHMVGQVVGVVGQHLGMGQRHLPSDQGLAGGGEGTTKQGPGGADQAAGRTRTQVQPVAQPGGGRGRRGSLLGPGGPAGIDRGQPGQPVAVQAVGQPLQPHHPLGQGGVGQAVAVEGGQALELGRQRRQPRRSASRMGVRVHGGNLSSPHRKASTNPKLWRTPAEAGSPPCGVRSRATPVPGNCMGPDHRPTHPHRTRSPRPLTHRARSLQGPRSPRALPRRRPGDSLDPDARLAP
jgi:hypothetical protein